MIKILWIVRTFYFNSLSDITITTKKCQGCVTLVHAIAISRILFGGRGEEGGVRKNPHPRSLFKEKEKILNQCKLNKHCGKPIPRSPDH